MWPPYWAHPKGQEAWSGLQFGKLTAAGFYLPGHDGHVWHDMTLWSTFQAGNTQKLFDTANHWHFCFTAICAAGCQNGDCSVPGDCRYVWNLRRLSFSYEKLGYGWNRKGLQAWSLQKAASCKPNLDWGHFSCYKSLLVLLKRGWIWNLIRLDYLNFFWRLQNSNMTRPNSCSPCGTWPFVTLFFQRLAATEGHHSSVT